jgi:hypothetical protein
MCFMVLIRFHNPMAEKKALGFLAKLFSLPSWKTGQTMVPESALAVLAAEGIRFTVEGPPTYEQSIPLLRGADPTSVQTGYDARRV